MTFYPPAHRTVPWDAGSRLNGRQHGDAHPHASGRGLEFSPLWISVARVNGSGEVKE